MAVVFDVAQPLPDTIQRDIEAVAANAEKLVEILQKFVDHTPDFSPTPVFAMVGAELSLSYSQVSKIFSAIETLSDIEQSVGGIEQLSSLLARRLTPERARAVEVSRDGIVRLLNLYNRDHPVAISIKAEKLSYLHQAIFQDAEIITDARPIFDNDGNKILEFVVTHSFVLNHYSFGAGARRLHFAMDSIDVLRLKEACERAIRKATTLKDALGAQWPVNILNDRDDNA